MEGIGFRVGGCFYQRGLEQTSKVINHKFYSLGSNFAKTYSHNGHLNYQDLRFGHRINLRGNNVTT